MKKRANRAFVTGAGSGIGRALCADLCATGVEVFGVDLSQQGLEGTSQACAGKAGTFRGFVLDVTDAAGYTALAARIEDEFGPIDLLINNAGIGVGGDIRDMRDSHWRKLMEVNFFGVVNGISAFYPKMSERRAGTIVNVASVAGLVPLPGEACYVASKHAVVGLSRTLAAEARGLGASVHLVCPGVVKTPIYDSSPIIGFDKQAVLSLWPQGVSPQECSRQILRGLRKGQSVIYVTRLARVLDLTQRFVPELLHHAAAFYMHRLRSEKASL